MEHNTFGIYARCRRFMSFLSIEEAKEVAAQLRADDAPYIIIGGGSNLLLTGDYDGTVVRSRIFLACEKGDTVSCGSGVRFDELVEETLRHGLYGLENLSYIPGDVGAAAVQNIGAYGVEVKDLIKHVWAIEIATGELRCFSAEECGYGYRYSRFKDEWRGRYLITQVDFQLSRQFVPHLDYGNIRRELDERHITEPTAEELRTIITLMRQEKLPDPRVLGNAGSFFMNPVVSRQQYEQLAAQYPQMPHYYVDEAHEKIPAGWMIEQCGWKGRSLGRAGVHDRQALVLVNLGGATGREIVELCHAIQHDVSERFGIMLQPEVNIV